MSLCYSCYFQDYFGIAGTEGKEEKRKKKEEKRRIKKGHKWNESFQGGKPHIFMTQLLFFKQLQNKT